MKNLTKGIYLLFIIGFVSCRTKETKEFKKLLIGNWKLETYTHATRKALLELDENRNIYYHFINDSTVDTKRGFYKRSGNLLYLGTITKYKIINDSIKLFNPTDSIWDKVMKLKKVTIDSLILVNRYGKEAIFLKYEDKKPIDIAIDQIALSTSGCYGTCSIIDIIIDADGSVVFCGRNYVDKLDLYEGKISKEKFNQIATEFKKSDIEKLKENYSADWTDDEAITTTFLNQNKIIKSIDDYGRASPEEFVETYQSLRYLFQSITLTKLDSTQIPFYSNLYFYGFRKRNLICDLQDSERFLLWNYLRKGIKVQMNAPKKFHLSFSKDFTIIDYGNNRRKKHEVKIKDIITDGRYYTFETKDHKKITVDIGFNFFETNRKFLKFREKNEHDYQYD